MCEFVLAIKHHLISSHLIEQLRSQLHKFFWEGGHINCAKSLVFVKKLHEIKAVIHVQIMSYSSQITPIHIPIYFIHLKTHVQGK